MRHIMRCSFSTLFFIAGFLLFPHAALAGGSLQIKCDSQLLIHKSLQNQYPPCDRDGSALPGDVVTLEGSGFTISTLQSPVVIDQSTVLVSGDRRIPVPRLYPVPPTSSSYTTKDGNFKANMVVPLETPPGRYEVSFKVTQRSCNFSKGVPCIVDIASAWLTVLPTAGAGDFSFNCTRSNDGAPSDRSCVTNYAITVSAKPLPTFAGQPVFLYFKKGNSYGRSLMLYAQRDHSISTTTFAPEKPGEYTIVLRSVMDTVKMRSADFEKIGPTITVVAPDKPVPQPPAQQPPANEHTSIALGYGLAFDQDVYKAPIEKLSKPEAFVPGARFLTLVTWLGGPKLREQHSAILQIGTGFGERFKELTELATVHVGTNGGPSLNLTGSGYSFMAAIPRSFDWGVPVTTGIYTLRIIAATNIWNSTYYKAELPIDIEIPRPLKPKISIPSKIYQDKSFLLTGSNFPANVTVTSVRFSADADPIELPLKVKVNKDGSFSEKIMTPKNADSVIKYVNGSLSTDTSVGKLTVTASVSSGYSLVSASAETTIPLRCLIKGNPSIVLTGHVNIDLAYPYDIPFDVAGFDCRSKLTMQFDGIKAGGKKIDRAKTADFFTKMPSFVTDYRGTASGLGFGSGWGAQKPLDPDITSITMIITDKKNRSASAKIGVFRSRDPDAPWAPIVIPGPRPELSNEPCAGLEGYFLRQCQKAYGITPPPEEKPAPEKTPNPPSVPPPTPVPCAGLEGYMLRSCQAAYGVKTGDEPDTGAIVPPPKEEKVKVITSCDPELPKFWQPGCKDRQDDNPPGDSGSGIISNPPTQEPVPPVTPPSSSTSTPRYCDPELPKVWQEGCVPPPDSLITAPKPICNPMVPSYSQPGCVPATDSNGQQPQTDQGQGKQGVDPAGSRGRRFIEDAG